MSWNEKSNFKESKKEIDKITIWNPSESKFEEVDINIYVNSFNDFLAEVGANDSVININSNIIREFDKEIKTQTNIMNEGLTNDDSEKQIRKFYDVIDRIKKEKEVNK